jgi:hypothetical protein
MTAWLQGLPLGATAPVTPSPEGCHPIPNGFNCNFDRQEEAMVRVAIYLDYFLLAILALLAIWIVASVISGRSLLPAPLERWRRRVPATPRDQRKQAAAQLLLLGGAMVNLALLLLQPPNTHGA